jgi:hypothetical protein
MKLFEKVPFTHENRQYEVRVLYDDEIINVTTFSNNYPANGFRYQIKVPKNVDIEKLLNLDNFRDFIEMAKNDIIENRWDKFKLSFPR